MTFEHLRVHRSPFFTSIVLSLVFSALIYFLLPSEFNPKTDIIGFPVHQNFNIDIPFRQFYFAVYVFPAMMLFIYTLLSRGYGPPVVMSVKPSTHHQDTEVFGKWLQQLNEWGPTLLVGLMVGIGIELYWALRSGANSLSFLRIGIGTIGYSLVVRLVIPWERFRRIPSREMGVKLTNGIFTGLGFTLLYLCSSLTEVFDETKSQLITYPWFPGLALFFSVVGAYCLMGFASSGSFWVRVQQATRTWAVWLSFGILIFLLHSSLGSSIVIPWDVFHEGENLVSADMISKGFFPFRDVLAVHGLWAMPLRTLLGFELFEHSRWGYFAGTSVVVLPLFWVLNSLVVFCLFPRRPFIVFCLAVVFPIVFPELFYHPDIRFSFNGIILALFCAALGRQKNAWFFLTGACSFLQFILVPEAAYWTLALGAACLYQELHRFERGRSVWQNCSQTLSTIFGAVLVLVIWAAYLQFNSALIPYIEYFTNFAVGHRYGSGLTGEFLKGPLHMFAMISPIVLLWVATVYFFFSFRRQVKFEPQDIVFFAICVFVLLYYQKFLSRMDGHVFKTYAPAIPALAYLAVGVVDRWSWSKSRWIWFAKWMIVMLLLFWEGSVPKRLHDLPAQFRLKAASDPEFPRAGFAGVPAPIRNSLLDFRDFFSAYLDKNEPFYDFTNHSGLFLFQLERTPVSRYHYVNYAMHVGPMMEIIQDLEASRPRVIVFQHTDWPNQMDNVPNTVRHYAVSAYVLENYKPFFGLNDYTVLIRKDLNWAHPHQKGITFRGAYTLEGLWTRGGACDWGYSPAHFSDTQRSAPSKEETALSFKLHSQGQETVATFESVVPPPFRFLEISFSALEDGSFQIQPIGGTADPSNVITFKSLGRKNGLYRVPVGSCPQWHSWSAGGFEIRYRNRSTIEEVVGVMGPF